MLPPLRPAEVRNRRQFGVQRAHHAGGPGRQPGTGGGRHVRRQRPRVREQRRDEDLLRPAVGVGVAPVGAGVPLRLAQALPARRPVHRAREERRVAERLRQKHAVAVRVEPVGGKPARHQRQETGGEVRKHPGIGKDQGPGIVRHPLEPPELLRRPPAGGSRDSGARPSTRPRAGAPPAAPDGPRPRTG